MATNAYQIFVECGNCGVRYDAIIAKGQHVGAIECYHCGCSALHRGHNRSRWDDGGPVYDTAKGEWVGGGS